MVVPAASNGQVKSWLTLFAAVTAAMETAPRPFTAVCTTMVPMAVTEYCRPIGTPMANSRVICVRLGRSSPGRKRRTG